MRRRRLLPQAACRECARPPVRLVPPAEQARRRDPEVLRDWRHVRRRVAQHRTDCQCVRRRPHGPRPARLHRARRAGFDSRRAAASSESAKRCRQVSVGPDDPRRRRRQAATTGTGSWRERRLEVPLPDDVPEIVVDPVDVVRAAADDGHRDEERDTGPRHTLGETVHSARLVGELRRPLQRKARLRQGGRGDLVVGADPAGALRVSQCGEPLRAAAAPGCARATPTTAAKVDIRTKKTRCSHHRSPPPSD